MQGYNENTGSIDTKNALTLPKRSTFTDVNHDQLC